MSFEIVRAALSTELNNAMGIAFPAYPVQFENKRINQPSDTIWIDFTLHETGARRASIGTAQSFQRRMGLVAAVIRAPENTGVRQALLVAETIRDLYEEKTLDLVGANRIIFGVTTIKKTGLSNGWYPVVLTCPFAWNTTKPA